MKKWVLASVSGQTEAEKKKWAEHITAPCYDWDFKEKKRFAICFSPIFLEKGEEIAAVLEENAWKKEDVILFSEDSRMLRTAQALGIATIGRQPGGEEAFLEGTDCVVDNWEDVDAQMLYRQILRANGKPWTILETERLVVREFQMSDLDSLFSLYSGRGMTDYIEPLYPYEEEKKYEQDYISCVYRYYGYGMWLVFEKETGALAGRAGIENSSYFDGELELGYAIGTPYQGKGYAKEVCSAICAYAREKLGAKKIHCMAAHENKASLNVAAAVGFTLEGECIRQGKRMCIMRCIL